MGRKPERTLELQVDIDAPLEEAWKAITEGPGLANWFAPMGEVSAPGLGATVTTGWSPEMTMSSKVDAWEPMGHVRWLDESGWMGPGTAMAIDYYLTTENGKRRVRLVQSAFGEADGWDDLFAGTAIGWTYFLQNLRVYLEAHKGRTRTMISERLESPVTRAKFWPRLVGTAKLKAGDRVELGLGDAGAVRGVVEMVVERQAIALRLPELGDALLFIELEGRGDRFHVGYWLSVYDGEKAKRVERSARGAFRRLHAT